MCCFNACVIYCRLCITFVLFSVLCITFVLFSVLICSPLIFLVRLRRMFFNLTLYTIQDNSSKSKLPFWSLWFGHFCHFSPKLKFFASGSLWFQFYCHFGPKWHFTLVQNNKNKI
ncbi:hypothetical protein Hanom_Chr07g00612801 [Helianthus anomalus]